jgi:hypothetical protein
MFCASPHSIIYILVDPDRGTFFGAKSVWFLQSGRAAHYFLWLPSAVSVVVGSKSHFIPIPNLQLPAKTF